MRYWLATLPALVGLILVMNEAVAQETWGGIHPTFESDLRQKTDEEEARRAERRKSFKPVVYPAFMNGGDRPDIKPAEPPIVYFDRNEDAGSMIVDTERRKLYFVLSGKRAYEYPISVGRDGFTWSGTERITRIAAWPSWTPPPEMRERLPGLPVTVTGGLRNPQGARALYLGSTIYRIHGTNNDRTVGRNNSSGCFRLTNEHVVHLASIAKVGAKVTVLPSYAGGVSQNAPLSSLFSFWPADEAQTPAKEKRKPVVVKGASAPAAKINAPAASAKKAAE
ncbi:MAG: L,D-transpeptidase [Hyphomicrobiales bacterium]|nr:L,D-transpeptidase [Hyphomicrobiales bacterium]